MVPACGKGDQYSDIWKISGRNLPDFVDIYLKEEDTFFLNNFLCLHYISCDDRVLLIRIYLEFECDVFVSHGSEPRNRVHGAQSRVSSSLNSL